MNFCYYTYQQYYCTFLCYLINMSDYTPFIDTSNKDIYNIYRIYKCLGEMLSARGYVIDKKEMKCSFKEFLEFQDDILEPIYIKSETDSLMIFLSVEENMGIKQLQNIIMEMNNNKVIHCIIIIKKAMTPFAKKSLADSSDLRIELFDQNELMVNITNTLYMSKHTILSNEQKAEILKKNKLQDSQIPRTLASDPVIKYYGGKRGNLIKIETVDHDTPIISYVIVV